MNRAILEITNNKKEPIYVQIDPWADLLYLETGEKITIAAYAENNQDVLFECIEGEQDSCKIIWLPNNSEYYFIEGNDEIKRIDYGSNIEGWSKPLHEKSSLKSRIKIQ